VSTVHPERRQATLTAEQNRMVCSHLEEILTSQAFIGSPRAQEFLKLIVNHALGGETDQLRERMIGAEMFGRPVSYDTGNDPVVRVKASEVRKKLAQFYSEAGHIAAVKIELPSGSYVPHFSFAEPVSDLPSSEATEFPSAVADAPVIPSTPPISLHPDTNSRWHRWPWAISACIAIMVVLAGIIFGLRAWQRSSDSDTQIRAIAILPFENLSGRPDQDYFADGMTDELITELGQATTLRVTSRTSAMSLKGSKKLLPEIARELGVDAVVEGTVQREGNEVRITAQLIDARHDRLLWAKTYNRVLTNVLALQSELAQNIADQVRASVIPRAQARPAPMAAINVEAEDLYLKGIQQLNADRCTAAIPFFEKAVTSDPRLARPHAAMASCYGRLGESGWMPYADAFSMQKTEATRAIQLDDSLSEGHAELANAAMNLSWDWNSAASEFSRALELNPSSAIAHERYAIYLERMGRQNEAIAEAEKGMVLDPVSDRSFGGAAFTYYFARRYDQALELHRRARANGILKQDDMFLLGDAYAETGQFAKSISAFLSTGGDNPHTLGHLGYAYARAGQSAKARSVIAQLEKRVKQDGLGRYEIALVYAALGDTNQAFAWLEDSFRAHNEGLTNLKIDPCLDSLRSDPRFEDLVRRVGLPVN
jgi:TolB-like protein